MTHPRGLFTRNTPQRAPLRGTAQVPNSAGGYAWAVDDWTRLDRFLILGSEGGSYYASERALTAKGAAAVRRGIAADGERAVARIVAISEGGRAPKNDPALFALAFAAAFEDPAARQAAFAALPRVARTGTHLLHFAAYVDGLRGWGGALRRAVAGWYAARDERDLAYGAVKYQSRDGWAQRDLLRLDHRLPREAVPTAWLRDPLVWAALLEGMPLGVLLRNLATLTRVGVLAPDAASTDQVAARLRDGARVRRARLHPIGILAALRSYAAGRGARGQQIWAPLPAIVDALDAAFYAAFDNAPATGLHWTLGLDVSGSMDTGQVAGVPGLTPRVAAGALALLTAANEQRYTAVAFTAGKGGRGGHWCAGIPVLTPLTISPRQRLDDVTRAMAALPMGGTDCALPIRWATARRLRTAVFVILTDNETWAGEVHPAEALRDYRRTVNPAARQIVVGLVANDFSIADPDDAGMLDIVGFDTATPQLLADFATGGQASRGQAAD